MISNWMVPIASLDNDQKRFMLDFRHKNKNCWIKGFPGSGKTVLLISALSDIVNNEPESKILITYFTKSLQQLYIAGVRELGIPQNNIRYSTYLDFQKNSQQYDYILCDEVQDLTASALTMMKSRCKQLLLAGDPNQSIYTENPQTGEPIVDTDKIEVITTSEVHELEIIHRLTKSVIGIIGKLMPNMDIFRVKKDETKKDVRVRLGQFNNINDEVTYITDKAFERIQIGESSVVLLSTHTEIINFSNIYCGLKNYPLWERKSNTYGKPDYNSMNGHLHDLKIQYIGNGYGSLHNALKANKLVIMTYHSAKGLDFENVYLPFLNSNADIRGEAIFMVALTRSRGPVTLSYTTEMHHYVKIIDNDQITKITADPADSQEDDNIFDFDF